MKLFKRKKAVDADQAPTSTDSAQVEDKVSDAPDGAPAPVSAESASPDPEITQPEPDKDKESGFFKRLRRGLGRTSDNLVQGLGTLFLGR